MKPLLDPKCHLISKRSVVVSSCMCSRSCSCRLVDVLGLCKAAAWPEVSSNQ